MLKRLKLKGKMISLISLSMISSIIVTMILSIVFIQTAYSRVLELINVQNDQYIKTQVESMIATLQANYDMVASEKLTEEEAMESAKNIVRNYRYNNGTGYFWADMADGYCAVHINPKNEGANRYDSLDAKGNHFVRDTISAGQNADGGYFDFYFPKPNETEPLLKRGYAKEFKPYGWFIGTGNYEVDMQAEIQNEVNAANANKMLAIVIIFVAGIVVFVISLTITALIAKRIASPIEESANRLEKLSKGDLKTDVIELNSLDEVGTLSRATKNIVLSMRKIIEDIIIQLTELSKGNFQIESDNKEYYLGDFGLIVDAIQSLNEKLNKALVKINQVSQEVASGAEQMSYGAQSLSHGTTEQASSIEELSFTIMEVSNQVKHNAQSSALARDTSGKSADKVLESNEQMQAMIRAMDDITSKSTEISKIIKTIDGIAFQTNILALNAAVEAARAGAAGKGFAVVADEVRNLASKSGKAAQNITELIEETVQSVRNGTKIADDTGTALTEVVSSTREVTQIIVDISSASEEQAQSIGQIKYGVDQISTVVQTNSATAEESAAASEELSGQAQMLKELVGQFKLKSFDNLNV